MYLLNKEVMVRAKNHTNILNYVTLSIIENIPAFVIRFVTGN